MAVLTACKILGMGVGGNGGAGGAVNPARGVTPEDKIQAPSGKVKASSDCGRPSTIAGAQPVLANM